MVIESPQELLLHDDFLARSNQACAFLADPFERSVELFLRLDSTAEVAPETDADDSLTVDDAAQLCDGISQSAVTGIALGAKLRNGRALLLSRLASLERC